MRAEGRSPPRGANATVPPVMGAILPSSLPTYFLVNCHSVHYSLRLLFAGNPGTGCAFSALAPEIARSDKRTPALASEQIRNAFSWLPLCFQAKTGARQGSRAILTFSALVGAMSLARAVSDEALSREIPKTVAELLKNSAKRT
jgi:hypothetical protein